ncbi:MAG: DNA topoisomerase 3 [Crocinitomicaceae bacterium]|nr:DNA topoisomerase 3 [Crocinitomicaceae bacterium]
MKLCIAEKPSVAKEIASILGANNRKDGYYEGNGYWVSWTFGHLCTLKEPHDYTSIWKWWNMATLPMIPSRFSIKVMQDQGVQKQFRTIQNLVERCDEVINCGDAGQEGELIQQWVLLKAKNNKPVKRLWISSLTEEAIQEGFQNLRDGKEFRNLYAAGSSRAIGDWLLGMNATRLYTLKYGQDRQVLSIGRVQTPTLAMIVERQKQIENFKPEKYWELKTLYREVLFSATVGRLKTAEKAQSALEYVTGKAFKVNSYEQKEGKEHPPKLFDLTSLQVEANNKFAMSADKTLKLVQNLYEKKLVTYPRVDTTFLSEDIYPKVPKILSGLTYFSKLTEPLKGNPIRKSKKVFNDKKVTDHHAIIPTGISPSGISAEEQKIYTTITKRFISVFYPDCKVSNTSVLGQVDELEFKATGKQIIEPGWRVVYEDEKDNNKSKNEDNIMPSFEEGETGPHEPEVQEKETRPPKYFTEATLLRAMETAGKNVDDEELRDAMKENGIGRPSTRANIIETLFRRRYIEKRKKNIHATITGVELIDTIKSDLLKSPELTGQWEYKLRQIEKGEYQVEEFKKELIEMVVEITNNVKMSEDKVIPVAEKKKPAKKTDYSIADEECPKCKEGKIVKGNTAYGCTQHQDGCDFLIPFEFMNKSLSDKQLYDLVSKGKTTKIKGFVVPGSNDKRDGKLIFTEDFNIELQD